MILNLFFFFKQKTAYEMLRSLVGSEMCIRDSAMGMSKALSEKIMIAQSRSLNGSGIVFCGTRYGLSLIHI